MAEKKENPHEGHREKLRQRFMRENGFEHFEDHQILELLLFYANPRKDTNPIAHALLDEFGSLKGVLEARPEMLMRVPDVGDRWTPGTEEEAPSSVRLPRLSKEKKKAFHPRFGTRHSAFLYIEHS